MTQTIKHSNAVADVLGAYKKGYAIDSYNRLWNVTPKHSGFILTGVNTKAYVPYWTSYFINIKGLHWVEGVDDRFIRMLLPSRREPNTIDQVIQSLNIQLGSILIDDAGCMWLMSSCPSGKGYVLEMYSENGFLPEDSCKVLHLSGLQLLNTQEQRNNRKKEFNL